MLWGLLIVAFAIWCSPFFFTIDNALLIANAGALTALFAAGVGIGIMTGVLDLSLPGTAALSGCVTRLPADQRHGTWLSLAAGLGVGVVVGVVNGLITLRGFNPIIVTIGSLSVLTGLAAVVAEGLHVPRADPARVHGHAPLPPGRGPVPLARGGLPGIPAPVFIVAVVFIVGTIFLTRTRDGLRLMAVGAQRRGGPPLRHRQQPLRRPRAS